MRQHLCEHNVKPTDTVPDATTATLQALTKPHVSAPQPAPTRPAQPMLPVMMYVGMYMYCPLMSVNIFTGQNLNVTLLLIFSGQI